MKIHRRNSRTFLLIILGMLSAFGPFVTDFYLPGLPSIGDYFDVPASMVQLSLTSSMLGLAGGQLLVGPISDKYGRKRPILITLGLFVAATVACLFAWDIYSFVLFRLFQGIAGAGGIVLSKSVAADLYEGKELRRFFSMLMVVNGLSPILAPVFGGFLLNFTDWHGIFVTLLVIGILLFAVNLRISESLLKHRRIQGSVWGTFRAFVPILRHRRFMYYVLTQAFGMGVFFTYIASSPFILQQHYGLSPIGYSVCFATNAAGIIVGSWLAGRFRRGSNALSAGLWGLVGSGVLCATTLLCGLPFGFLESTLFLLMVAIGMILPTSTALALDIKREHSGSASAVIGFFQFLSGAIVSPLTGLGDILLLTGLLTVCCSVVSLCFGALACRPSRN